jgi:hypothetical protein
MKFFGNAWGAGVKGILPIKGALSLSLSLSLSL